jgi:hypothetical protein
MRRRDFITLVGSTAASWPLAAYAQQKGAPRRVGFLLVGFSPDSKAATSFRQGLRDAGYAEGRDVLIEWRTANGDYGRVQGLIEDLIQKGVEVIVQDSTVGTQVAKQFDFDNPKRHGPCSRPGWIRTCCEPCQSRWQRYRTLDDDHGRSQFHAAAIASGTNPGTYPGCGYLESGSPAARQSGR